MNLNTVKLKLIVTTMVLAFVMSIMLPIASYAKTKTNRNRDIAIGLGAISAYSLVRGKVLPGILAGAGAYYAWNHFRHPSKNDKHRLTLDGLKHRVEKK